ncbi:MAG: alpha/beta fold hydrolase [Candidatus Melainabacteria bacterium]|nr:alpha/beta fold hydrolase [Candidatus Melainabacteria bacterium]
MPLTVETCPHTGLRYGKLHAKQANLAAESPRRVLIYIAGLGGSVKWALGFLLRLLPGFDVVYGLDLQGFGLNDDRSVPLENGGVRHQQQSVITTVRYLLEQHPEASFHISGISLGALLSTLVVGAFPQRFSSIALFAPAYQPHAKTFSLAFQLRCAWGIISTLGKRPIQLPYGLAQLTQNPKILKDSQFDLNWRLQVPTGYLWSIQGLAKQAQTATAKLPLPVWMVIPGLDSICDPHAMRQAFQSLPNHPHHQCVEEGNLFHDVMMEAQADTLANQYLQWIDALDTLAETEEAELSPDQAVHSS